MEGIIEKAEYSHNFGDPPIKVYKVFINGKEFQSWQSTIVSFIGKSVICEEIQSKNPNYPNRIKVLNDKQGQFGNKAPFKNYGGKSDKELILQSKTMVLSYVKDIVVASLSQGLKPDVWDMVKTGYNAILPLLALDKLSEVDKTSPQASPAKLKEPLVMILKQRFKGWSINEIIEFGGTEGIDIPHNLENGEVHWPELSESQAQTLLNMLDKS
jgi:hypothetical protein